MNIVKLILKVRKFKAREIAGQSHFAATMELNLEM